MSSLHSMKKEIAKNNLMFAPEMYNNLLGSVIISAYILSEEKPSLLEIKQKWRQLIKKPKMVDFWLDDPNFIDKALGLFGIKRPDYFPVAMVQSDFNALIMPYIDGQLYPLREDGVFPMTASKGKIYPIDFSLTNNKDGEKAKDCEVAAKSEVINNGERSTKRN